MVSSPKRHRTDSNFSSIFLNSGSSSKVPLQFTSGVLKTVPVSGGVEYDGNRLYFTPNSTLRKTLAFLDEIPTNIYSAKSIEYTGKRENNIGLSNNNGIGYAGNWSNFITFSSDVSGSKTSSNEFTRTTGTWTVDELKDKWVVVRSASESQYLKVKTNTTTILTFYDPIFITTPTVTAPITQFSWLLGDKYIDTGFTGSSFSDACFDGLNLWMLPNDTEQKIYKVNLISGEISTITHSITTGQLKLLSFDGKFLWCFNSSGGNHIRINTETNEIFTVSNTLAILKVCFDGQYFWCFGDQGAYKKYSLSGSELASGSSLANSKLVKGLLFIPSIPDKIFYIWKRISGTSAIGIDYLDISQSTPTWTSNSYIDTTSSNLGAVFFDGSKINITQFISLSLQYHQYNPYTLGGIRNYSASYVNPPSNVYSSFYSGEIGIFSSDSATIGYFYLAHLYNSNFPNYTFGGVAIIPNQTYLSKLGNMNKLILAGNFLIQYGGRYLVKGTLPKSGLKQESILNDNFRTFFEKGHVKKWKSIASNYQIGLDDFGLLIDTSSSSITITLPDASKCKYQEFEIKDDSGNCLTNNIVFNTVLSQTIDSFVSGNFKIDSNFGAVKLVSNGTNWRIL